MTLNQLNGDEHNLRRYEYEDRWVVAADLGVGDEAVSVDTVGDTAIVVVDRGDREIEAELELPGPAAKVDTNNGVVTFEIEK